MNKDTIIIRAFRDIIPKIISIKDSNDRYRKYCNYFEELSEKDQMEIIETIVDNQFEYLRYCIEHEENCELPVLGTFKIKKNKRVILKFKDTVAREEGFTSYKNSTQEFKDKINYAIDNANIEDKFSLDIRSRIIKIFRDIKQKKNIDHNIIFKNDK